MQDKDLEVRARDINTKAVVREWIGYIDFEGHVKLSVDSRTADMAYEDFTYNDGLGLKELRKDDLLLISPRPLQLLDSKLSLNKLVD